MASTPLMPAGLGCNLLGRIRCLETCPVRVPLPSGATTPARSVMFRHLCLQGIDVCLECGDLLL